MSRVLLVHIWLQSIFHLLIGRFVKFFTTSFFSCDSIRQTSLSRRRDDNINLLISPWRCGHAHLQLVVLRLNYRSTQTKYLVYEARGLLCIIHTFWLWLFTLYLSYNFVLNFLQFRSIIMTSIKCAKFLHKMVSLNGNKHHQIHLTLFVMSYFYQLTCYQFGSFSLVFWSYK